MVHLLMPSFFGMVMESKGAVNSAETLIKCLKYEGRTKNIRSILFDYEGASSDNKMLFSRSIYRFPYNRMC